jgi:hypothetical protein
MGQHKYRQPSLKIKLFGFVAGASVVTACVYAITHLSMGIFGARATGKMLGLGLLFVVAPIWAFLRKRRQQR